MDVVKTCATCRQEFHVSVVLPPKADESAWFCSDECEANYDGPSEDPEAFAGGFAENH